MMHTRESQRFRCAEVCPLSMKYKRPVGCGCLLVLFGLVSGYSLAARLWNCLFWELTGQLTSRVMTWLRVMNWTTQYQYLYRKLGVGRIRSVGHIWPILWSVFLKLNFLYWDNYGFTHSCQTVIQRDSVFFFYPVSPKVASRKSIVHN